MVNILYYIKNPKHLNLILLSIVVMSTTFLTYLPDKVDMIVIYIPQLILITYAVLLFSLYWKKGYRPKGSTKGLLLTITIFAVYYVLITGYRFISGGNAMQSLHTAIITFTSVVPFFLIDAEIIKRKNAFIDLIIVFTVINMLQLITGLIGGSIRQSPVLQNIMVYDTIMIFMVPWFFYIAQHTKELKISSLWELLCWLNLLCSLIFITASGSRSGMIIMAFTFLISMIINFKRKNKFLLKCMTLCIAVASIIVTLYSYNIMDFKLGITRQKLALLNESSEYVTTLKGAGIENDAEDGAMEYEKFVKTSITSSDDIRGILWEESIREIKKSPFLGTGTMLFEIEYFDAKLLQGSHNIILESSLAFGVIGMVIFFIMIIIPIIYILLPIIRFKMKVAWREAFNYMLSMITIFMMAMVQPVFVMAFPVILSWLMTGIVYKNSKSYMREDIFGFVQNKQYMDGKPVI